MTSVAGKTNPGAVSSNPQKPQPQRCKYDGKGGDYCRCMVWVYQPFWLRMLKGGLRMLCELSTFRPEVCCACHRSQYLSVMAQQCSKKSQRKSKPLVRRVRLV